MDGMTIKVPGDLPIITLLRALAAARLTLKHNAATDELEVRPLPPKPAVPAQMHAGD